MSAFTDKLHAFFSRFAEVSKADVAEVEKAVEEKVHPFVTGVRDELKAELGTVEQQAKADLATVEGQLKARLADLEAKVEALLGQKPAGS